MTEHAYVQGLKHAARNPAVSIRIVKHPKAPSQVVAHTVRLLDGRREAVRRARLLAPDGKEREVNPSTGMWKLALAIGGPQ
ncbi:hypothetical protein AB0C61_25170 [Streptomyces sp. NPDC048680]|uniref:hypothetical protein n=1 Tax=Streptomyces sp. NPDC048680 TaxID=3155492 RepID=UPI00342D425E